MLGGKREDNKDMYLYVSEYQHHLSVNNAQGCFFTKLPCPIQCGVDLFRGDLGNHYRAKCPKCRVQCQYCKSEGEYQMITGGHLECGLTAMCFVSTVNKEFRYSIFLFLAKHVGKYSASTVRTSLVVGHPFSETVLTESLFTAIHHLRLIHHFHTNGTHQLIL